MNSKVLILFAVAAGCSAQVYVSPSGDDANPGSQARPVRSLERARDLARTAAVRTVILAPGTYRLACTLQLDSRDAGTSFTGPASGEPAIVSGGIALTDWRLVDQRRNLWSVAAPAPLTNARQLYVDGVRATRTRGRVPLPITQTATGYNVDA